MCGLLWRNGLCYPIRNHGVSQATKYFDCKRPQECEMWKRTFLILAVLFSGRNKDPFIVPFAEHFVPSRASYGEFQ